MQLLVALFDGDTGNNHRRQCRFHVGRATTIKTTVLDQRTKRRNAPVGFVDADGVQVRRKNQRRTAAASLDTGHDVGAVFADGLKFTVDPVIGQNRRYQLSGRQLVARWIERHQLNQSTGKIQQQIVINGVHES
ncbi:hypothetical protein D3C73_766860 [compost metagenome]